MRLGDGMIRIAAALSTTDDVAPLELDAGAGRDVDDLGGRASADVAGKVTVADGFNGVVAARASDTYALAVVTSVDAEALGNGVGLSDGGKSQSNKSGDLHFDG